MKKIIKEVIENGLNYLEKHTEYYYPGKQKSIECYYLLGGEFHRENKPAYIEYFYSNENIKCEKYYINNKLHNDNGPAIIVYYTNGNVRKEEYYLNNECHREDGPAYIEYGEKGNILYENYYLNGKLITNELQIMVMKGLNKI